MSNQRENLSKEMLAIKVDKNTIKAMNELAYTAAETGLILFAFHDDDDIIAMIRLVDLARKYAKRVPDNLRM